MRYKLNTWQRYWLTRIITEGEGDGRVQHKIIRLLELLDLNDEERKQIEYIDSYSPINGNLELFDKIFRFRFSKVVIKNVPVPTVDGGAERIDLSVTPDMVEFEGHLALGAAAWARKKEVTWELEMPDGNLLELLRSKIKAYTWPPQLLNNREWRTNIIKIDEIFSINREDEEKNAEGKPPTVPPEAALQ